MIARLKVGLVALVALFGLVVALRTSAADDTKKSNCGFCAAVADVFGSLRCGDCKPDKQCDKCVEHCKKAIEHHACKDCKDKACEACEKRLKDAKCKFCAAKAYLIEHTWCCSSCEKDNKKDCEKCVAKRKFFEKAHCKDCEKKG